MTRDRHRRSSVEQQAIARAVSDKFVKDLGVMLGSINNADRRLRWLKQLFVDQMPVSEIARSASTTVGVVSQELGTALSHLRHPSRAWPMRDYFDEDFELLCSLIESSILRDEEGGADWIWCESHSRWNSRPRRPACPQCPCELLQPARGRKPKYCSDACRQQAFREDRRRTSS